MLGYFTLFHPGFQVYQYLHLPYFPILQTIFISPTLFPETTLIPICAGRHILYDQTQSKDIHSLLALFMVWNCDGLVRYSLCFRFMNQQGDLCLWKNTYTCELTSFIHLFFKCNTICRTRLNVAQKRTKNMTIGNNLEDNKDIVGQFSVTVRDNFCETYSDKLTLGVL